MTKAYGFGFYGLGYRWWSYMVEDYVAANLRQIPNVIVAPTRGYTEWRQVIPIIKALPKGSKVFTFGHSMGGASATYVTDEVHVDLVACYDVAGQSCSGIAKNCEALLDFQDTAFAIVPKFRPWAYKGHESKIKRFQTRVGHVASPSVPSSLNQFKNHVIKLTQG